MRGLPSHLTYANVISTLCLFLLLAGGTAYALDGSNTVFSDDIVNGEVKAGDIADGDVKEAEVAQGAVTSDELKNDGILAADLAPDAVKSTKVLDGTLSGADVNDNSLKGADIDEATLDIGDAARAYARVRPDSCTGLPGDCTPEQSKGISSVTNDDVGQYCVTASGIDGLQTPAAVTVDWSTTSIPRGNASAMTREAVGCGPGGAGFIVMTERQPNVVVDQGGMVGAATVAGPAEPASDVAFTIVIP